MAGTILQQAIFFESVGSGKSPLVISSIGLPVWWATPSARSISAMSASTRVSHQLVPLPKLASFPGRSNVELLAQDALLRPGEVVKCLGGEGLVHVETFGRIGRIFCGTIGFSTSRSYMSKRRQR